MKANVWSAEKRPLYPIDNDPYPDYLRVLALDGQMERRLKVDVLQVEPGPADADEQFRNLDVIIECSQVQSGVPVVLLLVNDPRPRQFRQQNPHRTENDNDHVQ